MTAGEISATAPTARERENELRHEGWEACLEWVARQPATCMGMSHATHRGARHEAARRYRGIDVERGPSGRWYRLFDQFGGTRRWQELRSWTAECEARSATESTMGYALGVEVGDEAAVAALLQRHAARRAQP